MDSRPLQRWVNKATETLHSVQAIVQFITVNITKINKKLTVNVDTTTTTTITGFKVRGQVQEVQVREQGQGLVEWSSSKQASKLILLASKTIHSDNYQIIQIL